MGAGLTDIIIAPTPRHVGRSGTRSGELLLFYISREATRLRLRPESEVKKKEKFRWPVASHVLCELRLATPHILSFHLVAEGRPFGPSDTSDETKVCGELRLARSPSF